MSSRPLKGRIALVAGATRGAGRGIAAALGEAGAIVYCTGRTSRTAKLRSDYARAETIEETAEIVTALGGDGRARVVDHLDANAVRALADELRDAHGHLDLLVNDIWGGEAISGGPEKWNTPIWKWNLDEGLRLLELGVKTHLVTAHHLLPLVVAKPGGLHVEVGDGTWAYNTKNYRLSVFYDLAKVAVNRLGFSLGHELAAHGCTALSITPGFLRSEMMLDFFRVTEQTWRDATKHGAPPEFEESETPRYVGRAIAALAADPDKKRWNQQSVTSGQLAKVYGFTDLDGSQPQVWERIGE